MIVVECYTDIFLIKSLGFSKKHIKHAKGKGNVLKIVKTNKKSVGIIDEDPQSRGYSEIINYKEIDKKSTIKLLVRKNDKTKRLIQISPYLEDWLFNRAKQDNISLMGYNLPNNPRDIHDPHIERNKNFQKFLLRLIKKDDEIKTLKKWINETIKL